IGSIRRECLDHFVILGEAHLRRILGAYATYYNVSRTHRSLDKDAPFSRQFNELEVSIPTRSLADCITIMSEFEFSVHTPDLREHCSTPIARYGHPGQAHRAGL